MYLIKKTDDCDAPHVFLWVELYSNTIRWVGTGDTLLWCNRSITTKRKDDPIRRNPILGRMKKKKDIVLWKRSEDYSRGRCLSPYFSVRIFFFMNKRISRRRSYVKSLRLYTWFMDYLYLFLFGSYIQDRATKSFTPGTWSRVDTTFFMSSTFARQPLKISSKRQYEKILV